MCGRLSVPIQAARFTYGRSSTRTSFNRVATCLLIFAPSKFARMSTDPGSCLATVVRTISISSSASLALQWLTSATKIVCPLCFTKCRRPSSSSPELTRAVPPPRHKPRPGPHREQKHLFPRPPPGLDVLRLCLQLSAPLDRSLSPPARARSDLWSLPRSAPHCHSTPSRESPPPTRSCRATDPSAYATAPAPDCRRGAPELSHPSLLLPGRRCWLYSTMLTSSALGPVRVSAA